MSKLIAQLQRPGVLGAYDALRRLFKNPDDTRQVFLVMEALRGRSGGRMLTRFAGSPVGSVVLAERRELITRLDDHDRLIAMSPGSLGRTYLAFMQDERLSAAGLVAASQLESGASRTAQARLFRDRMRDMHDLTHVLTGYGRDPLGELCLLAFMFRQTRHLGMAFIPVMAMRRFPRGQAGRLRRAAIFEAFSNGGRVQWLPGLDWEAMLSRDLYRLRQDLRVIQPVAYQEARR